MRRLAACLWLWLLLALPAAAQVVTVTSGEHAGFSRLVIELPGPTDWQFGRTADGYELRLGQDARRFDLSEVFDLIPRTRLASIWTDPVSGTLRLGIGCACHAMPFEFRPGVLVIDLRDGPPPPGSSFELALDGTKAAEIKLRPVTRPRARPAKATAGYNWLDLPAAARPAALPFAAGAPPQPLGDPAIAGLRDALLRQISRGAGQGVVEMADQLPQPASGPAPDPEAQVRIGQFAGFAANTLRQPKSMLIAGGADCIADERLDIASWADARPVWQQIAEARAGLTGEFDRPDPEAVARAARFYIRVGFGAEAARLLSLQPGAEDRALWLSMSKIVDGETDPGGVFAGMQVCNTAAALWAVLALPDFRPTDGVHSAAVIRTFSALPLQVRRHLGPALIERFLKSDDPSTAESLRNAILRAPGDAGPAVTLMEAELDRAEGKPDVAIAKMQALIADPGPITPQVLLALVDAQLAQGQTIDAATVTALAALAHEAKGTDAEPRIQRAHLLAKAASGDFDGAFAGLPNVPEAAADLWRLLAEKAPDSQLIAHAILPANTKPPLLDVAVRLKLAGRMVELGLGEPALAWIGGDRDHDPMLTARAELERSDAAATLDLIAGQAGAEAAAIRAAALVRLGDPAAASAAFAAAGDDSASRRALGWAQDWTRLATDSPAPWRAAAALVVPAATGTGAALPSTPLARSRAMLAESADARQTIAALLAATPSPAASE